MPPTLLMDNQSAIALAHLDQFHAHTKHIDIRYHYICKLVQNEVLELEYFPMRDMPCSSDGLMGSVGVQLKQ
ncbi:hypothetical protein FS837_012029 [Tulasnella sp. UAMH 9824]|nr:hypothetical protein FS837_012029 [Tulasnella sp. UAMH 9824]